VSRTSDRPRNANTKHSINWLPFGVFHDNVLIERNMLPDSSFGPAIQNVAPGNEKALGAYYPTSTYMTVADFEAKGCPGFTNSTAFGTQPGDLPTTTLPNTSVPGPAVALAALAGLGLILLLGGGLRRIGPKL
jgi:hypothetical protein